MQRRIFIILAIISGAVAIYLIGLYLKQERQVAHVEAKREIAIMQQMQASVLVAAKDMPKGTTVDAEMLESKTVPKEYVQPQAVSNADRIIGMITLAPISKGEQITLSKLVSSKQATVSSLAMATPVGKRAITISVDLTSSLVGMIRPGDYVDVIGVIPIQVQAPDGKQGIQTALMPLFQNVLVLAVGRDLGVASESPRYRRESSDTGSSASLITLALSPQEAALIAFAQEQSKIRLILRSPADSRVETVQPASWDTLLQYLSSQLPRAKEQTAVEQEAAAAQAAALSHREKPKEVEIYRGLKKEVMTLSK
jgi:pilus assembly protein CpaB